MLIYIEDINQFLIIMKLLKLAQITQLPIH